MRDDDFLLMCAGPTQMDDEVAALMAANMTNSTLDLDFFQEYKETCELAASLMKTENDVFIYNGEGLLGLEAACASLTEKGDDVLCLNNGIYGAGFGDFCKMYGANVDFVDSDARAAFDEALLIEHLKKKSDYKYATLVHCETPSGITNPIERLCPILKDAGIVTVVDAVSSTGGENVEPDKWGVDVLLVGSQKCLSAAPGLSIVGISDDAWKLMDNRKYPIPSYYLNLGIFRNYYEKKAFPYTQPVGNILSLKRALEIALERDFVKHHKEIGDMVRSRVLSMGLKLYPISGWSNTVTSICVPDGISFDDIFNTMLNKHNIMIAGSFGDMAGKVFRIGHMGHIANKELLEKTFVALEETLRDLGFKA